MKRMTPLCRVQRGFGISLFLSASVSMSEEGGKTVEMSEGMLGTPAATEGACIVSFFFY